MSVKNQDETVTAERIARFLEATKSKNLTELAKILGITPQSISGAIKRGKIPGDWVVDVAMKFKVSADWLLFGEGTLKDDLPSNEVFLIGDRIRPIRIEDRNKGAGTNFWNRVETIKTGRIDHRNPHYVGREHERDFFWMSVHDDSMKPTLHKRDMVHVDMYDKDLVDGFIYAIAYWGIIHLRRVVLSPGKWSFKAENEDYTVNDIEILDDDSEKNHTVEVLGKVIGWVHANTADASECYF